MVPLLTQDTILLHVLAPKRLLPQKTMVITAKLSSTWYEVLKEKLNLELTPERGVFACTKFYTPTAPRDGGGWRNGWKADLSEPVAEYVSKFKNRKGCYTVRLCEPKILNNSAPTTLRRAATQADGPQIVIPTQRGSGSGGQGGLTTTRSLNRKKRVDFGGQRNNRSAELRRERIQVENVKTFAKARMGGFNNAFLLRVRNEIQTLKQNNLWNRNVNRSPLVCHVLQEIFVAENN